MLFSYFFYSYIGNLYSCLKGRTLKSFPRCPRGLRSVLLFLEVSADRFQISCKNVPYIFSWNGLNQNASVLSFCFIIIIIIILNFIIFIIISSNSSNIIKTIIINIIITFIITFMITIIIMFIITITINFVNIIFIIFFFTFCFRPL